MDSFKPQKNFVILYFTAIFPLTFKIGKYYVFANPAKYYLFPGLEVLRRKTVLGRRTDEELYFMLSMFASFTAYKKMELSGGGYFYMNKEFIIGIVSTVFSYFIILYQFGPILDAKTETGSPKRQMIGEFFTDLEGLGPKHFLGNYTTDKK